MCCLHNMGVLRDRVVSPLPNPLTWKTGGSHFVGPLPFDLSGLGGPTRRRSSRRHSWGSPRHSSPPTTTRWRSFEDVLHTVLYIHFLSTDKENLFNSQELLLVGDYFLYSCHLNVGSRGDVRCQSLLGNR